MDEGLPDVPAARKKKKTAAPRGSRQVCMSSAIILLFKPMLILNSGWIFVNALSHHYMADCSYAFNGTPQKQTHKAILK